MKSFVAIGATSALMLAGLAFVATSPASASANIVFSGATSSIAGTPFSVTVTTTTSAEDVHLSSTCPFVAGTTSVATNGLDQAVFSGMQINVGSLCTLTAEVASGPDTGSSNEPFTITPGAVNQLVFGTQPPTNATSGQPFAVAVSIEDAYGNVEASDSNTIGITSVSTGCTAVSGGTAKAASAGIATFNISIAVTSAEGCVLTASDSSDSLTKTSSIVSVATNTASKLGFTTQPQTSVVAGTTMTTFAVSVEESNGIPFTSGTGSTDSIVLTSACALEGTTTVTAVAGVATFSTVAIKTGASCTLVATDASRTLATATSSLVTVLAGAATKVVFTTAPPTTVTTAGTLLTTFKVSVEDANGNVLTSGTGTNDLITITAASPCTLGGTTTGSAIAGVATFSLMSISNTGVCVLTATDSTRALTTAAATTTVGTAQSALSITSLKGLVGTPLTIKTSGGTGTGAVTLTTTSGTAGCSISGSAVKATRAGTCLVTATKAGTTTYISVSSAATTVTFVLPFKVTRVVGTIYAGRTQTITLIGSGFAGRPRIIANVGGFSAKVTRDTGRTLRVLVTVSATAKTGVHTMTVILSNGKRTSVKFSLR